MFGRSRRPLRYDSFGGRRTRWRPPRWLVLLVAGVTIGAAGIVLVQERYLPPRLSADASTKLTSAFALADADRQRLEGELARTTQKLTTALADSNGLRDALAASRTATEQLRDDLGAVVATLPPDPRGGSVAVRAAQFAIKSGALVYDVVLTRERAAKPIAGVMQLVVAGNSARGTDTAVALKPIALALGSHQVVRGSLPLPEGFKPRQATVQVLDRIGGRSLGMRVILVGR